MSQQVVEIVLARFPGVTPVRPKVYESSVLLTGGAAVLSVFVRPVSVAVCTEDADDNEVVLVALDGPGKKCLWKFQMVEAGGEPSEIELPSVGKDMTFSEAWRLRRPFGSIGTVVLFGDQHLRRRVLHVFQVGINDPQAGDF